MITLRSLRPPQAPRAAFGTLVQAEFRLAWRTPSALAGGLGLPLLLLVIYGLLPPFHQSLPELGGLTLFDVYFPVLLALVIAVLGTGLPGPLATYREQGILRRLSTTPVPPAWVLGAQLLVNMALAVLALLILVVVGMAAFGVGGPKSAGGLVLALLLSIAAIFAFGLCIGAVARGATMAGLLGRATFFALIFFAGLWVPRSHAEHAARHQRLDAARGCGGGHPELLTDRLPAAPVAAGPGRLCSRLRVARGALLPLGVSGPHGARGVSDLHGERGGTRTPGHLRTTVLCTLVACSRPLCGSYCKDPHEVRRSPLVLRHHSHSSCAPPSDPPFPGVPPSHSERRWRRDRRRRGGAICESAYLTLVAARRCVRRRAKGRCLWVSGASSPVSTWN